MLRSAVLASGLVLLLALAGCSGSEEDDASAAVAEGLMGEDDAAGTIDQEQADCVGDGFVEELGVDKLQEYGVITDELEPSDETLETTMPQADADKAAAVLVDCLDARQIFLDRMAGDDTPAEAVACLEDALTDDVLEAFFAATLTDDPAAADEAMGALEVCVPS